MGPNPWLRPHRPLVIAHRGHSVGAPEQTMAAYRMAIELGAEMIEADVRVTADGHLVMLHDATLDRTTSGNGPVSARTLHELRSLDAGVWFSPRFAGERVPTLNQLFDLATESDIALCLEAKGTEGDEQQVIAARIAEEIVRRGRVGVDVLSSFDHQALARTMRVHPDLATAPDRLPERGPSDAAVIVRQARAIGAPIVQHHHLDLDREVVAGSHAAQVAIWAWPVTAADEIARSLQLGVDGLMGDDVEAIVTCLREAEPGHRPTE